VIDLLIADENRCRRRHPGVGPDFGAAVTTQAIIDQPSSSTSTTAAALTLPSSTRPGDSEGNLNVSKFGRGWRCRGLHQYFPVGQAVVFVELSAGDLQVHLEDGKLRLLNDIGPRKFVKQVEHRTFSGSEARRRGQPRSTSPNAASFGWGPGSNSSRSRPASDIERDILARMEFKPVVQRDPVLMDPADLRGELDDLRERMLAIPLEQAPVVRRGTQRAVPQFRAHGDTARQPTLRRVFPEIKRRLDEIGHKVYGNRQLRSFDWRRKWHRNTPIWCPGSFDNYYFGVIAIRRPDSCAQSSARR